MLKTNLFIFIVSLGLASAAQAELITFDVNQAGFTAPAAASGDAGAVIVDDQFASIGVLFRDMVFPTLGVWVGNPHGPFVSSPNVLYSNTGTDGPETLVKAELRFVDPADINNPAYVTSVSGVFTDAGAGSTLTAYDIFDAVLGVDTAATGSMETLSLSGIGQIARVEFVALDATALDDINFDGLAVFEDATPIPTLSAYGIVLMLLGLFYIASRRLRITVKRT